MNDKYIASIGKIYMNAMKSINFNAIELMMNIIVGGHVLILDEFGERI